jgi:hypothetical protein
MLTRALTLDERVRKSELFPRIRGAENEMKQNELNFREKRDQQRKRRERQHKLDLKAVAAQERSSIVQENHYFTGFVLNNDPSVSKYMPFDEVYFPKLFNNSTRKAPPETINSLWMLGFEDHIQRGMQPKAQFVQKTAEMDISTLGSVAEASRQEMEEKNSKKSKHRFVAVYSNGYRDIIH